MNSSTAIKNSTLYVHHPGNVYQNDEVSEDCLCTKTRAFTGSNVPLGTSDALSVRKCEVIKGTETFMSRLQRDGKRLLLKVSETLCIPLKACSTLLNAGIFAGYYVTVMTITGMGALTGAMAGITSTIKARISSSPAEKSIKEYSVSYAQQVFKWLALPFETLPEMFNFSVFPVMASVTLFVAETVAIPAKRISFGVYEQVWNATYKATKAYKPFTDMTVDLFNDTKRWIQS
ncbi:hypothetical protein [Endozoicomonas sp. SESOKO1]|uniref:hypothetical protein n=1 Tax=Endozoicomonas sp. SESOKO1 TaxID=2828742 RepID=UPI0021488408|nr:hypothetical protein [Endozoicomonas sp. SESOKO1]